ncbi:MAG: HEPN domain-containing protein, partial [Candidatus Methanosuratincola sp.]
MNKADPIMVDYPTIALLPWLIIEDEVVIGEVHFVPFKRRSKSSNVPFVSQECARKIMSVYKDIDGRVIDRAVLAYHENQGTKGQLPEALFEEIFEASNILAFSALSEKEYFSQLGENKSINSAYFRTIFQRFQEPCKDVSYKTRTLDGTITNIDEMKRLKISKPLQCIVKPVDMDRFKFNDDLIQALYNAKFGNDRCKRLKGAISQFLSATKCDDWIAREQEYLDLIISYERLFDGVNSATDFADKISQILDEYGSVKLLDSKRLSMKSVTKKNQSRFLHYEFLKESYKLRNIYAHGKSIGNMSLIWTEREHYIFGCWMFPLVVKKILQDEGYYVLSDYDEIC